MTYCRDMGTVDTSRDAFAELREQGEAVRVEVDGEAMPMLLSWKAVKRAAKDWKTYSSDAPFRVPIPSEEAERNVRQLPIETDPPEHTAFRALVQPFFRRPMQPDYLARIEAMIADQITASDGELDLVRDFALPLQSRTLTLLLGMPESAAEIWTGWGTHVFRDGDDSADKGSQLDRYLVAELARAKADPSREDFFAALTRMEVDGRALTDAEMLGFANLTFAGGRDTVINSVVAVAHYFAHHPERICEAAKDARATNLAVEEVVRTLTPLTHIGRVCPVSTDVHGLEVEPEGRVSLCWAAANHDPDVFDAPEEVRLSRSPNAHVGFGSGVHTCLGAPQARAILRALIRGLAERVERIEIVEAVPHVERLGGIEHGVEREVGFERLRARIVRTAETG